jgi:hypothetical protein
MCARVSRLVLLVAALVGGPALARPAPAVPVPVRDGDLVFQDSRSRQSEAIKLATRSAYSHMGVVTLRAGKPFVFEAAAGVQLTPLSAWIARGEGHRVVVKRLKQAETLLTPAVRAKMTALARTWLGRPYDTAFRWDDQRLYCSELVYKLYKQGAGVEIGRVQPAGSFDLSSPLVRRELERRFGATFRADEPVISPQAMFEDPALETVYEN